jgi:hypothetical protein
MSKTGRGILRDPGPYFCLYSPECVEGEFSEVELLISRVLRSSSPENSHLAVQKYPPGKYASASCRLRYYCTLWGGGLTPFFLCP